MRWIVALLALSVASGLVWVATPRFIGSILKAPAHATLHRIATGGIPTDDELERTAVHLESVKAWESSAQLASEIGFVRLLQAHRKGALGSETAVLAGKNLRESLRLSPARPHPWVRLAYAEESAGMTDSEVAGLIQQSISAGPFVGEIALVRLKLLLKKWDSLPPKVRLYAFNQVRYMWTHDENFVIRAARQSSKPQLIRFALRPVPGALDRFDRAVPFRSN